MIYQPIFQLLYRLWQHVSKRRRVQFGILLIMMLLVACAEVISIGAVLPFLAALTAPDRMFTNPTAQPFIEFLGLTEPNQLLLPLTVAFAVGALFSGLMRLVLLVSLTRMSHLTGADLSYSIYRRTLYQPYAVHVTRNSSDVIAGITRKADVLVYSTILPLLNILSSLLMILFVLITLLIVEPVIAFITFTGFGVIYGVIIYTTKKILLYNGQIQNIKLNQLFKALQEGLGGIRDVLIDGSQDAYCKLFRNADLPLRRAQANITIISNSPRFLIEALGMVLISVIAFSLSKSSSGFVDAIPILGILALGAQRLLPMLQLVYSSVTTIFGSQVILAESLDLLDQSLPANNHKLRDAPIPFKNNITVNNLSFKYTDKSPWVLKNSQNLRILKGDRLGVIGITGSGKSTLIDIIMGLLRPTLGTLKVDGLSITEKNYDSWMAHVAHVPQSIFLADNTIAENIAFGLPIEQIDYVRVKEVANKAQIAETIESWPDQYNTQVGERGVRLSGGQLQRIGIARALYKKADVIVLDEATGSLDNKTELAVMESIEKLDDNLTLIIVAHRLTTLRNCSKIVELKDGQIEIIGSYKNVIND